MVIRSLIDKSTTLKKDNFNNFGLNPICMLSYGPVITRSLIHFDITKLKSMVDSKCFSDKTKLKHTLCLKNCGNIDKQNKKVPSSNENTCFKERATSFTILALKINKYWDMGVGFDFTEDRWIVGKESLSTYASNWYNSTTETLWDNDGIYNIDYIKEQYHEYLNSSGVNDTIIISTQKFDMGNENLNMDITDYVNSLLYNNEDNYGICLMFSPDLEESDCKTTQYVGFFNEKTNTIFTPILETRYDLDVNDSRYSFYLNKTNKLYLYSIINDKLENLDELPKCFINDVEYQVQQETKGIYYVNVKLYNKDYKPNTILYDLWTNLKYNGEEIEDAEFEFVTLSQKKYFNINETISTPKTLSPFLVGINNNEKINIGEIRLNKLFFRVPYTHSEYLLNNTSEYRIYTCDGDREYTIIDWDKLMNVGKHSIFSIDTSTLVPSEYHIDIRVNFGEELRIFKNETTFKVISNITNQKV